MSGLYWGALLLVAGTVLITLAILANETFESGASVPAWADYGQRHYWIAIAGILSFLIGLGALFQFRKDSKRSIEERDRQVQALEERNNLLWNAHMEEVLSDPDATDDDAGR